MTTRVLLMRGINIGGNRVPMADLRAALTEAGYGNVRTYVASGNVLVDTDRAASETVDHFRRLLIDRFDLDVAVLTRTACELQQTVDANPITEGLQTPKLYQVAFLDRPVSDERLAELRTYAEDGERVEARGHELYTWHPNGVAHSKLAVRLAARTKNAPLATARNWNTVVKLLEMASTA